MNNKRITGLFKKKRIQREEAIIVTKGGSSEYDESYNRLKDNLIYYNSGFSTYGAQPAAPCRTAFANHARYKINKPNV